MKHIKPGACASDSVARFFGMHTSDVPHFADTRKWWLPMRRFFARRGYRLTMRDYNPRMRLDSRRLYIMYGRTTGGDAKSRHMAVYRGHQLYYDPAQRRRAFHGHPELLFSAEKITP